VPLNPSRIAIPIGAADNTASNAVVDARAPTAVLTTTIAATAASHTPKTSNVREGFMDMTSISWGYGMKPCSTVSSMSGIAGVPN
jgi:hypothetical protein